MIERNRNMTREPKSYGRRSPIPIELACISHKRKSLFSVTSEALKLRVFPTPELEKCKQTFGFPTPLIDPQSLKFEMKHLSDFSNFFLLKINGQTSAESAEDSVG